MAGIDSTGFTIKRLPEILTSLQTKARTEFGSSINTAEDSILGHIFAIVGAEISDLWEATNGVYSAAYPSSAESINLDNVCSYLGIVRLAAQATTVQEKLTGSVNTIIPVGALFEQVGTGQRVATKQPFTMTATSFNSALIEVTTVAASTLYSVTIGGTLRSYTSGGSPTANTIASGLVAAINSPAFGVTAVNNLDGTFTISLAGVEERTLTQTANLTVLKIARIVECDALTTGPIIIEPNTITIISTPVFGLDSVTNPLAGVTGRNLETDNELRARRAESVTVTGSGTPDAIRAQLRQVAGVTNAVVIENTTNSTDGDGRPAKSFECVVEGGDDQDIGDTIWRTKPAGIETFGDVDVTVVDTEDDQHTVYFSRPELVYIHFIVEYTLYSEELFPSDGEEAIKIAMSEYGSTLEIGNDVILQRFFGPIYTNVQGLSNVTITVATSTDGITPGSYTSNNVIISGTQVPVFSTSRIAVSEAP